MAERKLRALLIDPVLHQICEVAHNGDFRQIYKWLSDPDNGLAVETFDSVMLDEQRRNVVYVDGDGLLKQPKYFFKLANYPQPLAGRGLVLGIDQSGEAVSASTKIDWLKANVSFPKLQVEGFHTEEGQTKIFGKDAGFIRTTPVFSERED